jgi:hypothetical protein
MFKPDERSIFRFEDRMGPRALDPMAFKDAFMEACGDESPDDLFRAEASAARPADIPDGTDYTPGAMVFAESRRARRKLVEAICKAAGVRHLDDDPEFGLTTLDLFRLWYAILEYMGALKKNTDATPSSPPGTVGGAT